MARRYTSAVLFHGPGSKDQALQELPDIGRQLCDPVGEEGLKMDDARSVVSLMSSAPVGDEPGCVLIGPMDRTVGTSADVLLKLIEEFDSDSIRPVLWAYDLGGVSPTIRSRCLNQWCPGEVTREENLMQAAQFLLDSSVEHDYAGVIEVVENNKDRKAYDFLEAVMATMALNMTDGSQPSWHPIWKRLRPLLRFRIGESKVSSIRSEIIACFCEC